MNRKAYDALGTEMPGINVLSCSTFPVPKLITDNTLGGSWFIQTVGTAAIKASVDLSVFGLTAKDSILTAWSAGASIQIEFDGYLRTGLIISEPDVKLIRLGQPEDRKYSVSFMFAVLAEEVSA